MVSVPKVYRGQWRSFAVSQSWEAVSQGHEAVTWEYKDENWILIEDKKT
jgi:hypothetical protein